MLEKPIPELRPSTTAVVAMRELISFSIANNTVLGSTEN